MYVISEMNEFDVEMTFVSNTIINTTTYGKKNNKIEDSPLDQIFNYTPVTNEQVIAIAENIKNIRNGKFSKNAEVIF